MKYELTLPEKLIAIASAQDLVTQYKSLSKQIREANDNFACFVSGQSQRHLHPKLNDHLRVVWVDELKLLKIDLEQQIVDCTFAGLLKADKADKEEK